VCNLIKSCYALIEMKCEVELKIGLCICEEMKNSSEEELSLYCEKETSLCVLCDLCFCNCLCTHKKYGAISF